LVMVLPTLGGIVQVIDHSLHGVSNRLILPLD
jgi:hypothetical protein